MSERPTCKTCPYWYNPMDHDAGATEHDEGECHRRPPAVHVFAFQTQEDWRVRRETDYPSAADFDWCGEHPDFPAWLASRITVTTTVT
jgi:hypothetical protein